MSRPTTRTREPIWEVEVDQTAETVRASDLDEAMAALLLALGGPAGTVDTEERNREE
jgi:hypothetical protein